MADEKNKTSPGAPSKRDPDDVVLTRLGSTATGTGFGRGVADDLRAYVDGEQDRTRKSLVGMGILIGCVALVFLIVTLLMGIFVQRGLSDTRQALDDLSRRLRASEGEKGPLGQRLAVLEDAQTAVASAVQELSATSVAAVRALDGVLIESEKVRTRVDVMERPEAAAQLRSALDSSIQSVESKLHEQLAALADRIEAVSLPGPVALTPAVAPDVAMGAMEPTPAEPELMQVDLAASNLFAVAELAPFDPGSKPLEVRVVQFPSGDHYEGEIKDGLMHGWGIYYSSNGDRYDGQFVTGGREGRGTCVFANGERYVGDFRADRRTGQGSMTFVDGGRYVGGFQDGMLHGRGTMLYADGRKYTGYFRGGVRHGKGILLFANGDIYRGDFDEDRRTGLGVYRFADGATYTGKFLDGQRHGEGLYKHPGGEEYMGGFRYGKRDGEGLATLPGGQGVKGIWEEGKLVRTLPQ